MTSLNPSARPVIEALYVERLSVFFIQKHDHEGYCSSDHCSTRQGKNATIFRDADSCSLTVAEWGEFL